MLDKDDLRGSTQITSESKANAPLNLVIIALILLAFSLVIWLTLTYGKREERISISFKPFTLKQLLRLDVNIDIKSLSNELKSDELTQICSRVEKIRGLRFTETPSFVEVSEKVLRLYILEEFVEESRTGEIEADRKLLVALGLLSPEEDLVSILLDVLTEQIIGTYNTEEKLITIVKGKNLSELTDELTVAHEVTHALQDQIFNLKEPPLRNDAYTSDTDLAIESLLEGDAMSTMIEYAKTYIEPEVFLRSQLESSEFSPSKLDEAPLYIRKSILFPYEAGLDFVTRLSQQADTHAVNRAFSDPPLSTEQILIPDKYLYQRDNPVSVELQDISETLGKGWKLINEDTMGTFDIKIWFELYDESFASEYVSNGWGGNAVQYYEGPSDGFVVINKFTWDTRTDAEEFYTYFQKMMYKRFDKAKLLEKKDSHYVFQGHGQFFYCGIKGNDTLCVQSNQKVQIEKALSKFPEFPVWKAHTPPFFG